MTNITKFQYCTVCDAPIIAGTPCKKCETNNTPHQEADEKVFQCAAITHNMRCPKKSQKSKKIWIWRIPDTDPPKYWCEEHYLKFTNNNWRKEYLTKMNQEKNKQLSPPAQMKNNPHENVRVNTTANIKDILLKQNYPYAVMEKHNDQTAR